ncbi:2051_t:CDS:2 [Funneliformis caledonium]|uniref:2051_t:CDS:1 n=1 Tax=Funneliformis caledonium TaxID=1117310 RepID=A0A9N9A190_9GLOM|nr:2051_t:CDS:2 [Funneliformis caledonium]
MTRKSEEDIEQEKLCDEERWADLDSEFEDLYDMSEEERDDYVEEKRKRKKMQEENREYNYSYSDENPRYVSFLEVKAVPVPKPDYTPKFSAPNGMITPSDNRIDEIIERTAKFLNSSTDPQMEIVIQAKQANNPSFSFLNKDDPLYPYYRHVRLLLQTGLFAYGGSDDQEDSSSNEGKGKNGNGLSNDKLEGNDNIEERADRKLELERSKVENSTSSVSSHESIPSHNHNTTPRPSRPPQPFGPIVVPPPDLKVIVDKMSAYVAKNGQSLEAKVREKHIDDPRFSFLLPWNEFHPYYKQKIKDEKATFESMEKENVDESEEE